MEAWKSVASWVYLVMILVVFVLASATSMSDNADNVDAGLIRVDLSTLSASIGSMRTYESLTQRSRQISCHDYAFSGILQDKCQLTQDLHYLSIIASFLLVFQFVFGIIWMIWFESGFFPTRKSLAGVGGTFAFGFLSTLMGIVLLYAVAVVDYGRMLHFSQRVQIEYETATTVSYGRQMSFAVATVVTVVVWAGSAIALLWPTATPFPSDATQKLIAA